MEKKTIRDIDITDKRVLVRVDYNVSLSKRGKIGNDLRISQSLPTIKYLLNKNCAVFLASHLGRPEGKKDPRFSLKKIRSTLEKMIGRKVDFIDEYIDGPGEEKVKKAKLGSINLLENIRFYKQEEKNNEEFSRKLASLAEVFVFDAFGTAHRKHASTYGVAKFLPSVAGLLLEKEISLISRAVNNPQRPFVVIIGGKKAETKIPLIESLLEKADYLLVDGAVGNIFLKAKGFEIGQSLCDKKMILPAKKILKKAEKSRAKLVLADDFGVGNPKSWDYKGAYFADQIPKDLEILDIGPKTEVKFGGIIVKAKTIIWNGPMGVFEKEEFARGTNFIYQAIAANRDSLSIIGGGETLTALPKEEYLETIDHISTGGGAMLEFIEKGTLPAIEALEYK